VEQGENMKMHSNAAPNHGQRLKLTETKVERKGRKVEMENMHVPVPSSVSHFPRLFTELTSISSALNFPNSDPQKFSNSTSRH